jgi:hypothetical protein
MYVVTKQLTNLEGRKRICVKAGLVSLAAARDVNIQGR